MQKCQHLDNSDKWEKLISMQMHLCESNEFYETMTNVDIQLLQN